MPAQIESQSPVPGPDPLASPRQRRRNLVALSLGALLFLGVGVALAVYSRSVTGAAPVTVSALPPELAPLAGAPQCDQFQRALEPAVKGFTRAETTEQVAGASAWSAATTAASAPDQPAATIVVRCGVLWPQEYRTDSQVETINQVSWFVLASPDDPNLVTWYTVDRGDFVVAVTGTAAATSSFTVDASRAVDQTWTQATIDPPGGPVSPLPGGSKFAACTQILARLPGSLGDGITAATLSADAPDQRAWQESGQTSGIRPGRGPGAVTVQCRADSDPAPEGVAESTPREVAGIGWKVSAAHPELGIETWSSPLPGGNLSIHGWTELNQLAATAIAPLLPR